MPDPTPPPADRRGPLAAILRNAGWLLGSKGVGGVFSLVYLALAAQSLGLTQFGLFALVLAYGQGIANLVQFQTWQVVVRYGAQHLAAVNGDALRRIVGFCGLLDLGAAAAGAIVGALAAEMAGRLLDWPAGTAHVAALFAVSLVFGLRGTPTGVLRLFDRFDLAALGDTAVPTIRLLGALAATGLGAGLTGFLIAWALSEIVAAGLMWAFALRETRRRGLATGRWPGLAGVRGENPGLWRFAWLTNAAASITLAWQQLGTLAVGWVLGPAAAGLFRIAFQFAQALQKPGASLTRAIYPELARMVTAGDPGIGRVLAKATGLAALGGIATVVLVALAGKPVLGLVAGPEFVAAYLPLLLLTVATSVELAAFGLEPMLVAAGRPGTAVLLRAGGALVYLALLGLLLNGFGVAGAGYAAIAATLATALAMAVALARLVRR